MDSVVFPIQSVLFGHLFAPLKNYPTKDGYKYVKFVPLCLTILTLTGTAALFSLVVCQNYYHAITEASYDLIPQLLYSLSYISEMFRGFFVIVCVLINRREISLLIYSADAFVLGNSLISEGHHLDSLVKRWQRRSIAVTLSLCSLHAFYTVVDWSYWFYAWKMHWLDENAMAPLPIKMTSIQLITQWVFWVDFPFVVSQLTFAIVIVLAWIVSDAVRNLLSCMHQHATVVADSQDTLHLIKSWRREHMRILIMVEKIKDGFSGILFMLFCCDLLAMASFISQLLNNAVDMRTVFSKSRLFGNFLLFMAYQTICVIPLVSANEQSRNLGPAILAFDERFSRSPMSKERRSMKMTDSCVIKRFLERFEASAAGSVICFEGLRLVEYSRSFVAGSLLAACTFAVVIHEVANEFEVAGPVACFVANSTT